MENKSQLLPIARVIGDPDTLEIVKAIVVRRNEDSCLFKPLEPMVANLRLCRASADVAVLRLRETSDIEEAVFDIIDFGVSRRAVYMAMWRLPGELVEETSETFNTAWLPPLAEEQLLELID